MDSQRFDELTKALATGTSRRSVLRTALGGMGAGLLALTGIANAGAVSRRRNTIAAVKELRACIEGCQHLSGLEVAQCITACVDDLDEGPVPEFCGGFGNLPCPEGFTCVDDPNDDCDPMISGRDCGGICVPSKESGGVTCGQTTCPEGEPCCNPSCGICGEVCTQQFCGPG